MEEGRTHPFGKGRGEGQGGEEEDLLYTLSVVALSRGTQEMRCVSSGR